MKTSNKKKNNSDHHDYLAFCLQGGGSLGAYQVGIIHALQEAGYEPDWFVGTSIGAINSALAAGNSPKDRIDKMETFWNSISNPAALDESLYGEDIHSLRLRNFFSSQRSLMFGQPNFFSPRLIPPYFNWNDSPANISFYDTSELKSTLERLIDFDRINSDATRLSVGAVEVCTGKITYFDSKKQKIFPEHIMASGALPPGFPAIEVEGEFYWDGGISSNSPVSYVLQDKNCYKLLCFMVHLFDSYGLQPTSLDEVLKRKKDIEFSSRFAKLVQMHQEIHALKFAIHQLSKHIPKDKCSKDIVQKCVQHGWNKTVNLVRFLYQGDGGDLSSKDYEFSAISIEARMQKGYEDGIASIKKSPWNKPVPEALGIALHDMAEGKKIKSFDEKK